MFSFFKRRDPHAFPADEYGDALYAIIRKDPGGETQVGIDLTFTFAAETAARRFAERIAHASYKPEIEEPDAPGEPWTVETMRETQPRHALVKALVQQMRADAAAESGTLSQWDLFW